jgi:RNA polymerase sigma factor (sigma-70 family)
MDYDKYGLYVNVKHKFLTSLVTRYEDDLYSFILKKCLNNTVMADDVYQDTLKTSTEKYDVLKIHPEPKAWLYKVATYNYLNELIRVKKHYRALSLEDNEILIEISHHENVTNVFELCEKNLSKDEYNLIEEQYVLSLSLDEMAKKRNIKKSALKTKMSRLRGKIKNFPIMMSLFVILKHV